MQENWNPWILDWNSKPQKFFKKNPEMEKSKKTDPNHNWSKPQKFFQKNPRIQIFWRHRVIFSCSLLFFSFGFYGQRIGCWCKGCCHQWYRISLYCLPWFGHEATRSSILGHSILCHVIHLGLGLSIRHCGNHFVWSYGFPTFLEKIQNLFSGCYLYNWFYLWITSDNKSK